MIRISVRELGEVVTGHTPPTSKREYYGDSVPFLKPTDMVVGQKYTYFTEEGYSDLAVAKYKGSLIPKGATCVVCIGTLGEKMSMAHCNLFTNQSINSIIPNKKYDQHYVYYLLKHNLHRVKALNKGTASGREFVSKSMFLDLEIDVIEDVLQQKKIAQVLSAYDDLIENNQKQIKLLEEAAQRLYKEWFVNLRFPGHENVKIIDGVPEGWEKKNLGSLIEVVRGRSYSSDELSETGGVLMVNLSNIRPFGGYNRAQEKHYNGKYTQEQTVKSYDLIMGLTDMTQERRTVGRVAIVPELRKKAIISMDLIKLVPKEGSSLFFYALLSFGGYSEVISRFANGTNVLHLRPDVLDVVDVLSPPKVLQENYSDFFKKILNKINDLEDQILLAIEARDRLLPKLMSGEIEL